MNKNFYELFEAQHRGSRELIKERLKVYLPFVKQVQKLYPDGQALDVGCGRGEWLELLKTIDLAAHGFDLDEGMLSACKQAGLSVTHGDAIAGIKALPDNSQIIVSGFHIAEHLTFEDLQTLVHEAVRVLKPAGLLILETPNPENLVVGTANFYIDPTHQRPIPQPLLAFLSEYYGFARTKVLRLQESPELVDNLEPTLFDVISGASPDYAVIAQKSAEKNILATFDTLFEKYFGLSVETLAIRYDNNMQQNYTLALQLAKQSLDNADQRILSLETQLAEQQLEKQSLLAENQEFIAKNKDLIIENQCLITENHEFITDISAQALKLQQLEAQLAEATYRLHRYATSLSWRLTLPLRLITRPFRALLRSLPKIPGYLLRKVDLWILSRPDLQHSLKKILRRYPRIYQSLLCLKAKLIKQSNAAKFEVVPQAFNYALTPAARTIYNTLKHAISEQEKK